MTTYDNPISADLEPILANLQRASVRCAFSHSERIDMFGPARARALAHHLAVEVLGEKHADRIEAAYFGQYDTGDRVIPVFPREVSIPEWASVAREALD